jgi:hypothetical protein
LGEVSGSNIAPVIGLKQLHQEDCAEKRTYDEHRYMDSGTLSQALKLSKEALRQQIKRLRAELAELYEAVEGEPPSAHLLIHTQSQSTRSYRLDPDAVFIEPSEV